MKLVGAKKFLRIAKPGMFFLQFWTSVNDCYDIINKYQNNKFNEILDKHNFELYIYGDNSGSLNIEYHDIENEEFEIVDGKEYNCLLYTDLNIIGDACPYETLYLVFDNVDELYDISIVKTLTKEELIKIRDWFLDYGAPFTDEANTLALKAMEEFYPDDIIVNYK